MIARLAHLAFQVRDLDAALAFYRDGLGLPVQFAITYGELLAQIAQDAADGRPHAVSEATLATYRERADEPWLVYLTVAPGQFLELFPAVDPDVVGDPLAADEYAHLCLEVEDAAQAWSDLRARGIIADAPPRRGLDNSTQFWITDPDGHRIELMQYSAASFQIAGR